MEKWLLMLLLEASTLLLFASAFILWRIRVLKKAQHNEKELSSSDDPTHSTGTMEAEHTPPFKSFANKLDQQAQLAADKLIALRESDNMEEVTKYKLWGTLLKAERAIVLNDASDKPKPFLNRFMTGIVNTLESVKIKQLDRAQLSRNIEDADSEFHQAGEILISKEALIENQKALHDELQRNIDDTSAKLLKLDLKNRELSHLKNEHRSLKTQIEQLETDHNARYIVTPTPKDSVKDKHHSNRHLLQLQRLSERQQAIIEHLQEQLVDNKDKDIATREQASEAAITRMERMAKESSTLIGQLQTELESTNLSISALKEDINHKNAQLLALDEKIKETKGGVLGGFMALHSNKQNTIESLIGNLATARSGNSDDHSLENQEREVSNLERILKESETCVQLLAQELESAELENETLREQADKVLKNRAKTPSLTTEEIPPGSLEQLNNLRLINRDLVSVVSELKEKLVANISNQNEKQLRNEYNRKSLELDRLQLAYSDLERKYLGTLR